MKRILFVLICKFFVSAGFGQNRTADEYRLKLDAYRAMHPPAMVFFHLDKFIYQPGDSVHYKAYQIESEDWKPRPNAQFFDVRIVESSTGRTIQNEKIIVDAGVGLGSFKLSPATIPGSYKFIADSHLMNFDAPDIDFVCDFIVSSGQNSNEKTDSALYVECFIEGGKIVQGLLSHIVVKASKDGIGKLVNSKGDSLASVPVTYGFSSFKYRPRSEDNLFVQFGNQRVPLPTTSQYGTTLSIDNQENDANLALIFAAKLPTGVKEKRMLLMSEHDGKTGLYFDIVAQNGKTIQIFPKAALRHGINRFMIIDSAMNIVNERLYYYHNPSLLYLNSEKTVRVDGNTEEITLKITAEDKDGQPIDADLSISVTDSTCAAIPERRQNIVQSFSIQQNLEKAIEGIANLFRDNRVDDSRMLDLCMLSSIYGRYKWPEVSKYEYKPLEPFRIPYADERRAPKEKGFSQGNGLFYWNPALILQKGKGQVTFRVPKGLKLHYTIVGFDKKGLIGQLEF